MLSKRIRKVSDILVKQNKKLDEALRAYRGPRPTQPMMPSQPLPTQQPQLQRTQTQSAVRPQATAAQNRSASPQQPQSQPQARTRQPQVRGRHQSPAPASHNGQPQRTQAIPSAGTPTNGVPQGAVLKTIGAAQSMPSGVGLQDESDFIATYTAEAENDKKRKHKGRRKPKIPFGADKSIQEKRDSYKTNAVDDSYDPDSIDFSRVRGYRGGEAERMAVHSAATARSAKHQPMPRQRRSTSTPRERAYEPAPVRRQRETTPDQRVQQAVSATRAGMDQTASRLQEEARARAEARAQERLHREAEEIRKQHEPDLSGLDA